MKYVQIFLVSLTILSVLMFSAVSASDFSENNSTLISDAVEEISETAINNAEQISDGYEDAVLSEVQNFDGTTFTELQDKINNIEEGDSLKLMNDIVQDSNSQIEIIKTISIDGNGHTIDALGKSGIFRVNGENIVLKNIKFINARSDSWGSAISWEGYGGILTDCIFINNTASYGGAVYLENMRGIVSDSIFENNSAQFGGALGLYEEQISVDNCTFINNSAGTGGAVDSSGWNCQINNSRFINNSASIGSGAIAWYGEDGVLFNSSFVKNHADMASGAIDWTGDNGKISQCIFNSNYADDYGALSLICGNIFVNNTQFINNTAISETGGAIYSQSDNAIFNNILFENNSAIVAGAIYWAGQGSKFENITFLNNSAKIASDLYINGENSELIDVQLNGDENSLVVGEDVASVPIIKKSVHISLNLTKFANNALLDISLSKNINDTLVISLNGVNTTVNSVNGTVNWKFSDLEYGNYTIEIYMGDRYYYNHVKENFTVNVKKTRIKCEDLDIILGNRSVITLVLLDSNDNPIVGRTVDIKWVNGTFVNVTDEKGYVCASILFNNTGIYPISVSFNGDELYLPSSAVFNVKVKNLISANVSIKKLYNDVTVDILLSEKINSSLKVLINDKEYDVNVVDGKASLKLNGLKKNEYKISLILNDDVYTLGSSSHVSDFKVTEQDIASRNSHSKTQKIKLALKKVKVKKSAKKLVLKATLKINGKLAKGKKVTFKFNKKTYRAKTNKKGVAKIIIKKSVLKKLKVGKKVKYQVSYGKTTVKKTVKVKK